MAERLLNVLFPYTHHAARRILGQALLNHIGHGRFKAFSAGSGPRENPQPHPPGLQALRKTGIPTGGLRSKNRGEFDRHGARPGQGVTP